MTIRKQRVECAGRPFNDDGNNDYGEAFKEFYDHIGVYVFQCRDTREVLYIGESHTASHPLGVRIGQHYGHRDTGGNFRIEWCKKNCKLKECKDKAQCSCDSNLSFVDFKCLIRRSRLIVFSFDQNDSESVEKKVKALESALIWKLQPTYNTDMPHPRQIDSDCVDRAVACIRNEPDDSCP